MRTKEELPECRAAAQLWEEKLYIPKKIILRFERERMGVEAADFAESQSAPMAIQRIAARS